MVLFIVYGISTSHPQTFEEVERRHWECMENEWERDKQKILNSLLGSGQDSFEFQHDPEVRYFRYHVQFDNMIQR